MLPFAPERLGIDEKMVRLFGQICEQLNIDLEESARSHAVLICF